MNCAGLRTLILLSAVSLGPPSLAAAGPAKDQEILNQAKILMMEQKWEEARQVFQRLIREFPQSPLLSQAYFHTAYCLRLQNRPEEALVAYDQFLKKYPKEPFLAAEAGRAVVNLAASLVEQGKAVYRSRLVSALADPNKEVRYFAAFRCSSLKDRQLNSLCVPVLKEIVAKEKELDLVTPASIALLRIDPAALAQPAESKKQAKGGSKQGNTAVRMIHLQIFESGEKNPPTVELNFPVSFAQLLIAALDEPTKAEIRKKGFDIENISESLNRLSPTNILTIRNGPRVVKLWIQ
ncbi:MAG: tetratricopeptide repeat protein [Acidobacteriia bacterium]|nr:tetratricopeptide repeat protein [Terriglobia bacterium]